MPRPMSQDLRDRVLFAYDRGMKTKHIADVFCVSRSWARRHKQRRRETGETTPRRMGSPGVVKVDRSQLTTLVREHPDATLAEYRVHRGVQCAVSTISMALKKLGFSSKKRQSTPRSGIGRMSSNVGPNGVRGGVKPILLA